MLIHALTSTIQRFGWRYKEIIIINSFMLIILHVYVLNSMHISNSLFIKEPLEVMDLMMTHCSWWAPKWDFGRLWISRWCGHSDRSVPQSVMRSRHLISDTKFTISWRCCLNPRKWHAEKIWQHSSPENTMVPKRVLSSGGHQCANMTNITGKLTPCNRGVWAWMC